MVTDADRRLRGRSVRFRIRDVHLPAPTSILHELHDAEELTGTVIDLSDTAGDEASFAVIEVTSLNRPCIVPVDRLLHATKEPAAR